MGTTPPTAVAVVPPNHDSTLPPLARGSGAVLPKLNAGHGILRGGSRDCGGSMAAPLAESSERPGGVSRSGHSGSSKAGGAASCIFANDFQWTLHSRDLPPSVRPIVEDNKMLQEELRRYRQRVGEQEGTIGAQDRQIVALRDDLLRVQQHLKECSVSPGQLLQEQQYRQTLLDRDASIHQLQLRAAILEKAKEAADRRLRNDLAMERRQQAELKRQIKQLQDEMAKKQKQGRFNQLHINQLYKRLEPLEAAVAAAAAAPPPPEPMAPPLPAEERVQLMLCMVYAQPQATAREIAEAAARLEAAQRAKQQAALLRQQAAAARQIQAAVRGFQARSQLAAQQQQAATAIQAHWRGMLARRAVAPPLQLRMAEQRAEASLTPAERLLMRQQAAERQYRERAAAKGKPQKRLPARQSFVGSGRQGNTAPEAAARQRSRQAGLPPDAASSTGTAASSMRAGSSAPLTSSSTASSAPSPMHVAAARRGSLAGTAAAAVGIPVAGSGRRGSGRPSIGGMAKLDLPLTVQAAECRIPAYKNEQDFQSSRGVLLVPRHETTGFGSRAPRRSIAGGLT